MGLIAEIVDSRWQPGIGDPTLLGWGTVAAYAVTLVLCVMASQTPRIRMTGEGGLWASLALLMLALGINKQLDLQTWFTQVARDLAISQGWYAERRTYQGAFILAAALGGLVAVGLLGWLAVRRRWSLLPLAGAGFLGSYVVVRAASFHHVDQIINLGVSGARLSSVIEIVGIAVIGVSAFRASRRSEEKNPKPRSLVEIVAKHR